MKKTALRLSAAAFLIAGLSACESSPYGGSTISADGRRAAGGAVAGALIATAINGDPAKGALIGAGAGALCDDVGVCQRGY